MCEDYILYDEPAVQIMRARGDNASDLKTQPAVKINGEYQVIAFELRDFIAYHRITGMTFTPSTKQSWGKQKNPIVVRLKISLVIFYNQQKLKLQPDEMAMSIQEFFPKLDIKSLTEGVKNTGFTINEAVLNHTQVFADEFKNIDPFYGPEYTFLKINYTAESTVSNKCFNTICK